MSHGYTEGLEVDRIDNSKGYSPDNCRLVTRQQNCQNRRGSLSAESNYKGVSRYKKSSRWRARIRKNKKEFSLGVHYSEVDAAIAYDKKAIELFGEYALLNFPRSTYE